MKRSRLVMAPCVVLMSFPLLLGCGTQRFAVTQRPTVPFKTFGTIEVKKFSLDLKPRRELTPERQEMLQAIVDVLSASLELKLALLSESPGKKGFLFLGEGRKLVIEGKLIVFEPDDWTMPLLIRGGKLAIAITFRTEEGETVAGGVATASTPPSIFGGKMWDAAHCLVDKIVDFVAQNFEQVQ